MNLSGFVECVGLLGRGNGQRAVSGLTPVCSEKERLEADVRRVKLARHVNRIEGRLKLGRLTDAEEFYRRDREAGRLESGWYFGRLILAFGELHSVEKAEMIFEDYLLRFTPEEQVLGAMMRVYADHGIVEKIDKLRSFQADYGVKSSAATYKEVLRGYVTAAQMDRAELIFACMEDLPEQPDREAFLIMLDGYTKDLPGLQSTWKRMKTASNVRITPDDCAKTIEALGVLDDVRSAESIFEDFEKDFPGRQRTTKMLASITKVYGEKSNLAAVRMYHAWATLLKRDDEPEMLNTLLRAYLLCGDLTQSLAVRKKLLDLALAVEEISLVALLTFYAERGAKEDAMDVYNQLREPSFASSKMAVRAMSYSGDMTAAEEKQKELTKHGNPPDVEIFNVMVEGYLRKRQNRDARRWLRRMDLSDIKADSETYRIVLEAYVAEFGPDKCVVQLLKELAKCIESITVFTNIVFLCTKPDRDPEEVERELSRLTRLGKLDEQVGANLALQAHLSSENSDGLWRVW
eukprot:CAMPEP_0113963518 /NCGR_PEP_ID=MMETSP0011_2-20120614/6563_1 /TAXON_ID=101924 /ORGANISM="Rhodosorus marinus" /LENGTH=518 /DNA_ID=CAMNT_0000975587 /DNA_START=628 /DNA_END=2181 /DNA_ORIENTATION=- /assembly_acc=CAM_ASM_000156